MNVPHNYISPLPPKEQKALYTWYTFSVWTFIVLIALLISINAYQYVQILILKKRSSVIQITLKNIQLEIQHLEKTKAEQALLQQYIETMHTIYHNPFNPKIYIEEIAAHIPPDLCLAELSCSQEKTIALQGYANKVDSVIAYVQSLQKSSKFEHLEIASLFPAQSNNTVQWFRFSIKGTLKI